MGSIIGGQWGSAGSAVVTAAIYYWIYWLVHQVKVLRSQIKASPESLAHGYTSTGAPLRLFYACFFYTGLCSLAGMRLFHLLMVRGGLD